MSLLLDTNILVDYVRREPIAVAWLRALPEPPHISVISLLELYVGARSQREERDIETVCAPLKELSVSAEIAKRGGGFMRHFGKSHGIDIPDAVIAATAEHHGLRLATLNVKHFPMFPKLKRPY
ncbi:MAG: type II toxin-antitoxin system VapC family toxin [Hyphomicrobiaceae bacterium]